ncbi:MAG: flippase-like domain-containing protein, partial [Candidatus Omnitrophica bacterium]|nr:flippase-like domain-containing protein [Candidatus Omnitrophota bacterium]
MKTARALILRLAISACLMALLLHMARGSIPKMRNAILSLSPYIFLVGIALFLISLFIISIRLKILLNTQGISCNIAYIVKINLISHFFSSFLPTSAGGDIVKAFYIARSSNSPLKSYTIVFLDRFIGMFTIFLIGSASLFYLRENSNLSFNWLLPGLLIISVILIILLFNKRIAKIFSGLIIPLLPHRVVNMLGKIYNAVYSIKEFKTKMTVVIILSIVAQIVCFSAIC